MLPRFMRGVKPGYETLRRRCDDRTVVEFRVLGPLEAIVDGRPVSLQAAKPRALLALLLLGRNRVVPVDRLVDGLWGDNPPATAVKGLQVYVSQLRRAIGADSVLTTPPGYLLRVEEGALDLDRFELLVREGRERLAAGDPAEAARLLEEGLALWRGPALAGLASEPFGAEAAARLEDARLAALEDRIEADLALGRHGALIGELEELVAAHPLRERPRAQLMLALYRSGRQADALDLYRRTRATFVEELGIEPRPELQELERAILRQDPELRQPSRSESRPAEPEQPGLRRRRRPLVLAVALAVAALAAGALALALTNGASSSAHDTADLRPFVGKLENFLVQSREGRREVTAAVAAAAHCRLGPGAAVARLDRVQRNRQSLLQQVAALSIPADAAALRASDTFQKAEQASIAADWHYRDWLYARRRCGGTAGRADLLEARAADLRATRLKQEFLSAFNPLARRYGQRTWNAAEF
jgi:DNA-binding SARP family transcriptional activator